MGLGWVRGNGVRSGRGQGICQGLHTLPSLALSRDQHCWHPLSLVRNEDAQIPQPMNQNLYLARSAGAHGMSELVQTLLLALVC